MLALKQMFCASDRGTEKYKLKKSCSCLGQLTFQTALKCTAR